MQQHLVGGPDAQVGPLKMVGNDGVTGRNRVVIELLKLDAVARAAAAHIGVIRHDIHHPERVVDHAGLLQLGIRRVRGLNGVGLSRVKRLG